MRKMIGMGIITLTSIIWITGCSAATIGKEKVSEIYIEKDKAEQLAIDLKIDYGQVDISSGANPWVDGEIKYNIADLEPKVKYKSGRKKGKITINQPKKHKINLKKGSLKNKWDLQLSNDVPVELNISTGASDTNLNLQGMQLRSLDVETGVGKTTVNLAGVWQESFNVNIQMGVGESTVILPKEVGVEIKSSEGIGSATYNGFTSNGKNVYVNDAFEDADVIISVQTELGIGQVNFELE